MGVTIHAGSTTYFDALEDMWDHLELAFLKTQNRGLEPAP